MSPIVAIIAGAKPPVGEEVFLGVLDEATQNTADPLHWVAPGFVAILARFTTPPDAQLEAYVEDGKIGVVVVPAPGRKPTRCSQLWVKIPRPPRRPSDAPGTRMGEPSADGADGRLTGALDDDAGATG